ncbi:MAG: SpoVA/SpoVAEb family sporulation membrane protein [Bacilli bacterium]|nr:SpoVA/SpoVAEb family sporulation membrane protein [Bacilli bacterium]
MKDTYQAIVKKHTPKEDTFHNAFITFITGGLMGVIGEFLIEIYQKYMNVPYKEATTCMLITLIFISCLFTSLGFFDKWVNFCKCGLIIPITGFAHATQSAALEYKKEGLITGIGANMLKLSGAVIIYGIIGSFIFSLLRALVGIV